MSIAPWNTATMRMLPPVALNSHVESTLAVTMLRYQPTICAPLMLDIPGAKQKSGRCQPAQETLSVADRALNQPCSRGSSTPRQPISSPNP